ncbi:MAG: FRG domain-containing protein [Firmicutes bacterium HGW-Firmicutes-2]|jgi:hypothetical protein|nr:MAG: FRG domain-containing protein [Firmicutes bacterium HGW-Firmicutes-2]
MRKIYVSQQNLTRRIKNDPAIARLLNQKSDSVTNIMRSNFVDISTFSDLVKEVAELSYLNQDYMLFYRGQGRDYKYHKYSTLYPSIYRDDKITKKEMRYKFSVLEAASNMLKDSFEEYSKKSEIIGFNELRRIDKLQWSILQHYEVCETPFLDLTHSLRVACSFALNGGELEFAYIYMLAMPYLTGRISINSEHDLVNIRLLSISPPQALRPFFQEGYLSGTEYIRDEYQEKNELDFNRRLIAVYRIPNNTSFWGLDFNSINNKLLFPESDELLEICKNIKSRVVYNLEVDDGSAGRFLFMWNKLEYWIRKSSDGQYSVLAGLKYFRNNSMYDNVTLEKIDDIRHFRNTLVHDPMRITLEDTLKYESLLESIMEDLDIR